MKNQTLYFIGLIHNITYLKEELSLNHPHWHFDLAHHNFLTYKVEDALSLEKLHSKNITFALCVGELHFICNEGDLTENITHLKERFATEIVHKWDLVEEKGQMGDRKSRSYVIDVIRFDKDQYALGARLQIRGDFAPYTGRSPIPMPKRSPSTAYQKIGEAFKHFRPLVGHDEVILDIGCSPGGSTYYLLNKGFRVIGVDPTDLDPVVREDFDEGLLTLSESFDELKVKHLKGLPPVSWVIVDIDLGAIEVLETLLKLISKLDSVEGIMMNVKMKIDMDVSKISRLEQLLKESDFGHIKKAMLPSHDHEFCLYATSED